MKNLILLAVLMWAVGANEVRAGGFSRSADEITASYMEGVVSRVWAQTVFGKPAPVPLASRCSRNVISKIQTAAMFREQITFKVQPRKCTPVQAQNFSEKAFDVIYPKAAPCGNMQELLKRVLSDPQMSEIRLTEIEYDFLGFSNLERHYIFLYSHIDRYEYEVLKKDPLFAITGRYHFDRGLARVVDWQIHDMGHYCKISIRTNGELLK